MKILKVIQPSQFEFEEVPIPVPSYDEVLLKVKYCGICGSDVRVFTGNHPYAAYPRIMGHEICGTTLAGINVSVNPYFTCGHCQTCTSGKRNCCLRNQTMGVQRDGAYAEYIVVPKSQIIENESNVDPKLLALTEPYGVGYHAINRSGIKENDSVIIFGSGPIGIFSMLSCKAKKAKVHMVDPHNEKLLIAKILGADDIVNIKSSDMRGFLQAATWGAGYDVCIDATGSKDAIKYCFEFVKTGGKIVFIGHSKEEIPMPHSDIIKKELTIFASRNSIEFKEAQKEISIHERLDKVITNIVPFEEVPEFYKRLVAKEGSIIKALIEF